MLKIGSGNQLVSTGKTFTGRVVQTTAGGYLVKFGENGRYTGVVETETVCRPTKIYCSK